MKRTEEHQIRESLQTLVREMAEEVNVVVVEGPRDRAALRALGFRGPVVLASGEGRSRADLVESLVEEHRVVALLTDFDAEGRALSARLRSRLERAGVKVAAEWRMRMREVLRETGCRTVEGLMRFAEE